jgi:hypothetical protein
MKDIFSAHEVLSMNWSKPIIPRMLIDTLNMTMF